LNPGQANDALNCARVFLRPIRAAYDKSQVLLRYGDGEFVSPICCRTGRTRIFPPEHIGTVAYVVLPTAIDRRDDLALSDRFDVYYDMGDNCIGVADLDIPEFLPAGALADVPETGGSPPIDGQSQTTRRGFN